MIEAVLAPITQAPAARVLSGEPSKVDVTPRLELNLLGGATETQVLPETKVHRVRKQIP